MQLSFGQKLTLAVAAAVAILLATAVVSYRNTRELLRATDAVSRSQAVVATLDRVAAAMSGAEALLRADVRADRRSDASVSRARRQDIEALVLAHLDTLGRLAEFDTIAAAGARSLDARVRLRLAEWPAIVIDTIVNDTIVNDSIVAGAGSVAEPAATPNDSTARESARAELAHLRDLEGRQLQRRSAAARSGADRAEWILFVGLLLVLALAPLAYLMVRNDFRLRLESERRLQESETRFRAATDGSLDAFYVLRAVRDGMGVVMDFEFVDLNARAETLLGHRREMVLGQRLCELIPTNRSHGHVDKYRRVLETSHVLEEEFEVEARGYHAAWIHHQVVPLDDGVAITSRDITERKQQEEALRALSLIDELTGLYNRRGFLTLAQQQLKQARRGHRELVLLFIDMDDFKEINDNFGHSEGDAALVRASQILKHTFRDSDIVARVGGDEFVVLATDTGATGSEVIISRLRQELRERNERDGYPYRLSFSVGASRFDPEAPPSIEELMVAADHMLYAQKRQKRQAPLSAV
ncbi:MAG: GGDEF domain-containing protein [Gemmatimonadaceae bacterium]|nr:GGDEF domain-containing protein [Gemmatimonadaceae bacterium]